MKKIYIDEGWVGVGWQYLPNVVVLLHSPDELYFHVINHLTFYRHISILRASINSAFGIWKCFLYFPISCHENLKAPYVSWLYHYCINICFYSDFKYDEALSYPQVFVGL